MANINDKVYDPSTETVRVGFGSIWIDVFKFVEEYGRMVVGAREPTVGMGFLLGGNAYIIFRSIAREQELIVCNLGGVSHLSNAYGFAVDNVVSYDIVLANGTAVTASATSHSELFFSLKAGTNNYGKIFLHK
jgi:FAD/FMN-containing dehydrogenase